MGMDSMFIVREAFEYVTKHCGSLGCVVQTTEGADTVLSTTNGLTRVVLKEDAHTATIEVTTPDAVVGVRAYADNTLRVKYVAQNVRAQVSNLDAFLGQEPNNVVAKEVHSRLYVDGKNNPAKKEFHIELISAAARNLGDIEWFLMRHVLRQAGHEISDGYADMRMREVR